MTSTMKLTVLGRTSSLADLILTTHLRGRQQSLEGAIGAGSRPSSKVPRPDRG